MEIMRTFRFQLKPSKAREAELERICAGVRKIYNMMNEERIAHFNGQAAREKADRVSFDRKNQQKRFRKKQLAKDPELAWLTCVPSDSLDALFASLQGAWDVYHKNLKAGLRCKPPAFRNAVQHVAFTLGAQRNLRKQDSRQKFNVLFNHRGIRLPLIGWIPMIKHRHVSGVVRTATVKREGKRWHVCLTSVITIKDPKPKPGAIGIDLGNVVPVMTTEGATWQEGIFVARQIETLDEAIKAVQRKLERAQKGSNRRRAHREDLAELHRKKAEQVKAQAHKAVAELRIVMATSPLKISTSRR
jgi:putative transposase